MDSLFSDVTPRHSRSRRILPLNESAFDTITEESAYWAGFLMADGCISDTDRSTPKVSVRLAVKDRVHLEAFRDFLGSKHAIVPVKRKHPAVDFRFRSARIVDALASLGILPRKTHAARFLGGLEYNRHAWRGVIDGDGSLGLHGMGRKRLVRPMLSLAGSEPLMRQFIDFARTVADCALTLQPHGKIWKVQLSCNTAYLAAKSLYEDCTVALSRKLATAVEIIRRGPIAPYHKDWSWLTAGRLQGMYEEHDGSWSAVARTLGLCFATLKEMREHRGLCPRRERTGKSRFKTI